MGEEEASAIFAITVGVSFIVFIILFIVIPMFLG
jgi:hypothetical protein